MTSKQFHIKMGKTMNRLLYLAIMSFIFEPAFAQKTTIDFRIPYVDVVDSSFSLLINSVIQDAKSCSFTKNLPCSIIARKSLGKSGNYSFSFSVAPFDELELLLESHLHINDWGTITINGIPIIFLYNDADKFNYVDSVDITINTLNRTTYQYVYVDDNTTDLSEQTICPLVMYELYIWEDGEYRLLYKDQCIDISKGERREISRHSVLYIFRE